jgi:hypothetical protein
MVRQQQAQAITPPPAGVHIGTEAFAVAGTNEWHVLTQIKDADCDPVVGMMGVSFVLWARLTREQLWPPESLVAYF